MKNLQSFGIQELNTNEIREVDGGYLFGTGGGINWGNFWKGVGVGTAIGGSLYIAQQYA